MDCITMSRVYKERPSSLLHIEDEYTAYCFDEACCLFINNIDDKKTPMFEEDRKENKLLKLMEQGKY